MGKFKFKLWQNGLKSIGIVLGLLFGLMAFLTTVLLFTFFIWNFTSDHELEARETKVQDQNWRQRILNSWHKTVLNEGEKRRIPCADLLRDLNDASRSPAKSFNEDFLLRMRNFYHQLCEQGDDYPYPLAKDGVENKWIGPPHCLNDDRVLGCRYNVDKGRGYLILRGPFPDIIPGHWPSQKYLVCAQSAVSKGALITHFHLESDCAISSLDFNFYRYFQTDDDGRLPSTQLRSDVMGLFLWPYKKAKTKPIHIPQILARQCETIFADAYYCTPTLLILPTLEPHLVDVCSLRASSTRLLTSYFSFRKNESDWTCKQVNLKDEIVPTELKMDEVRCVPKIYGGVRKDCYIPYIPRLQELHLVRSMRCFFAPRGPYAEWEKYHVCEAHNVPDERDDDDDDGYEDDLINHEMTLFSVPKLLQSSLSSLNLSKTRRKTSLFMARM